MTNEEIIRAKKQVEKIKILEKKLAAKKEYLMNKVHLCFDEGKTDTTQAEDYILNYFWQHAYENYIDGGCMSNDLEFINHRFLYETSFFTKLFTDYKIDKDGTALDFGCGSAKYTEFFAKNFKKVIGVDISKSTIEKHKRNNKLDNVEYICANILDCKIKEKFDFIYDGGIFTCIKDDLLVKEMIKKLTSMLKNKNSIFLVKESIAEHKRIDYKSINYIAYYRTIKDYSNFTNWDEVKINHVKQLGWFRKYCNIYPEKLDEFYKNPLCIDKIVPNYNKNGLSSCFLIAKGN